jgi:hypothetical protein
MTQKKGGRPRTGARGVKMSEYPRVHFRLPPETLAALWAWSAIDGRAQWQLVAEAVTATVEALPADMRRRVDAVRRARAPRA